MPTPTEQYIATIETPPVLSLAAFQAALQTFRNALPQYSAELSLELAPLQDAAVTESNQPLALALNNALQRTQFLLNRLEQVQTTLAQVRQGLADLETDQAAVIAGGYPAPPAPISTP